MRIMRASIIPSNYPTVCTSHLQREYYFVHSIGPKKPKTTSRARRALVMLGMKMECFCFGNRRIFCQTVHLNPNTNTPGFHTAAGSSNYRSFDATYVSCNAFHKPLEQTILLPPDMQCQREENDEYIVNELLLSPLPDNDHVHKGKSVHFTAEAETQTTNNVIPKSIFHEPGGPCPLHPNSKHKWKRCSQYEHRSVV